MRGLLTSIYSKQIRAFRKQGKELLAKGYRRHETDWEIMRGHRMEEVIIDAVISTDGKYVYTKLGRPKV